MRRPWRSVGCQLYRAHTRSPQNTVVVQRGKHSSRNLTKRGKRALHVPGLFIHKSHTSRRRVLQDPAGTLTTYHQACSSPGLRRFGLLAYTSHTLPLRNLAVDPPSGHLTRIDFSSDIYITPSTMLVIFRQCGSLVYCGIYPAT
jgi:hypothetical protein